MAGSHWAAHCFDPTFRGLGIDRAVRRIAPCEHPRSADTIDASWTPGHRVEMASALAIDLHRADLVVCVRALGKLILGCLALLASGLIDCGCRREPAITVETPSRAEIWREIQ